MAYPDAQYVASVLLGAGIQVRDPGTLEPWIVSARRWWEAKTGYSPFWATGADWRLDVPDDGLLTLPNGLLEVSSVETGVVNDTDAGNALTLGSGYETWPSDALSRGRPVERLRVPSGYARHRSLRVRGLQGRLRETDEEAGDVTVAVALVAAASALPAMLGTDGPVKKVTQGPVTIESDTSSGSTRAQQWLAQAEGTASEYRRLLL